MTVQVSGQSAGNFWSQTFPAGIRMVIAVPSFSPSIVTFTSSNGASGIAHVWLYNWPAVPTNNTTTTGVTGTVTVANTSSSPVPVTIAASGTATPVTVNGSVATTFGNAVSALRAVSLSTTSVSTIQTNSNLIRLSLQISGDATLTSGGTVTVTITHGAITAAIPVYVPGTAANDDGPLNVVFDAGMHLPITATTTAVLSAALTTGSIRVIAQYA